MSKEKIGIDLPGDDSDNEEGPRVDSEEKRPEWISDEATSKCMKCKSTFTQTNRRHHCRRCGQLLCGACTSKKCAIPKMRFFNPVRVCEKCWNIVVYNLPDLEKILAEQEKKTEEEVKSKQMSERSKLLETKYKIRLTKHVNDSKRGSLYKGVISTSGTTSEEFAVKFFTNDFKVLDEFVSIKAAKISHPNLVNYNTYYPDIRVLVSEVADTGSLLTWIRSQQTFNPSKVISYAKQLASGLSAMHAANMVFGDLSLSNILLDKNMTLKIPLIRTKVKSVPIVDYRGTTYHIKQTESYTQDTDVRLFGMLLAKLLTFGNDATEETLFNHVEKIFKVPSNVFSNEEYVKLMESCLQFNPPINFFVTEGLLSLMEQKYFPVNLQTQQSDSNPNSANVSRTNTGESLKRTDSMKSNSSQGGGSEPPSPSESPKGSLKISPEEEQQLQQQQGPHDPEKRGIRKSISNLFKQSFRKMSGGSDKRNSQNALPTPDPNIVNPNNSSSTTTTTTSTQQPASPRSSRFGTSGGSKIVLQKAPSFSASSLQTTEKPKTFAIVKGDTSRDDKAQVLLKQWQDATSAPDQTTKESKALRVKLLIEFGVLGVNNEQISALLLKSLDESDDTLRREAIIAVGKVKAHTNSMISALVRALRDNNEKIRAAAASAIGNCHSVDGSVPVLASLMAIVGDEDENVRAAAVSSLVKVGKKDVPTVTKLISLLFDDTNVVRASIVRSMIEDQLDPYMFLTLLMSKKSGSSQTPRTNSNNANPNAKGIADQFKIADSNKKKELLQNIKPEEFVDEILLGAIVQCAMNNGEEETTRLIAIQTLTQIDQEQFSAMNPKQVELIRDCLIECLKSEIEDIKTTSLECVESMCISDKKIASQLAELMRNESEDDEIREACARILGYLNVPTEVVLKGLVESLSDELIEVRQHSATSLGLLGVGSEAVLNGLTLATQDEEYIVRNEASKALKILEKAGSFMI